MQPSIFGKLPAEGTEFLVNQIAIAIVEIQSHVDGMGIALSVRRSVALVLPREADLTSSTGSRALQFQ